jgi:hypothetical protein
MVDEEFERFVTRYVLPLLFMLVAGACLVMLAMALAERSWTAVPAHALAILLLAFLADVCRRRVPPLEPAVRRALWVRSLNHVRHLTHVRHLNRTA